MRDPTRARRTRLPRPRGSQTNGPAAARPPARGHLVGPAPVWRSAQATARKARPVGSHSHAGFPRSGPERHSARPSARGRGRGWAEARRLSCPSRCLGRAQGSLEPWVSPWDCRVITDPALASAPRGPYEARSTGGARGGVFRPLLLPALGSSLLPSIPLARVRAGLAPGGSGGPGVGG